MTEMLYTVKEASEILKTNTGYVYSLIKSGQLKSLKLGSVKIRKLELERFLAENEGKDLTDPFNIKNLNYEGA